MNLKHNLLSSYGNEIWHTYILDVKLMFQNCDHSRCTSDTIMLQKRPRSLTHNNLLLAEAALQTFFSSKHRSDLSAYN